MDFRKPYQKQVLVQIEFKEPTMTQQHFKEECDVNNIMAHWTSTGELPSQTRFEPRYVDSTQFGDYKHALDTVLQLEELFEGLPKNLQNKFNYDIPTMIDWLQDETNFDEAQRLGLILTEGQKEGRTAGVPDEVKEVQIEALKTGEIEPKK